MTIMTIEQKIENLFESFWDKYKVSRLSAHDSTLYHLLLYFMEENKSASFEARLTDINRYLRLSNEKIVSCLISLTNEGFIKCKQVDKGLFNITICDG